MPGTDELAQQSLAPPSIGNAARRVAGIVLCILGIIMVCAAAPNNPGTVPEQKRRIVIATKMLLDGRGHVLRDTRIVVEGSKIVELQTEKDVRNQRSAVRGHPPPHDATARFVPQPWAKKAEDLQIDY